MPRYLRIFSASWVLNSPCVLPVLIAWKYMSTVSPWGSWMMVQANTVITHTVKNAISRRLAIYATMSHLTLTPRLAA